MTHFPANDRRLGDAELRGLVGDDRGPGSRLAFWQEATAGLFAPDAATERCLAALILAQRGERSAAELRRWRGPMLAEAASMARVMAQGRPEAAPVAGCAGTDSGPGQPAGADVADVIIESHSHPWRGFFGLDVLTLRHRRHDGGMSTLLRREVFVAVDAASVLPWDAEADSVLVVEQLRVGPLARGARRPWLVEAIAGRVDPGETPEDAAWREAGEEAGLTLGPLVKVAGYYPSPGALSEYIHSFVAPVSLAGVTGNVHGVEGEGEDIRSLILPFEDAMARLRAGSIVSAPLVMSLLWLEHERDRRRRGLPHRLAP